MDDELDWTKPSVRSGGVARPANREPPQNLRPNHWLDDSPGPKSLKEFGLEFLKHTGDFLILVWAFSLDSLKAALVFIGFVIVEIAVHIASSAYQGVVPILSPFDSLLLSFVKGGIFVIGAVTVLWILAMGAINVGYAASRTAAFYAVLRRLSRMRNRGTKEEQSG